MDDHTSDQWIPRDSDDEAIETAEPVRASQITREYFRSHSMLWAETVPQSRARKLAA